MRSTTISIIIVRLLALTLAAPAGDTPPTNMARDFFDELGKKLNGAPPSPWAGPPNDGHDIFDGLPPPGRRASSPGSQDDATSKLVKKSFMNWLLSYFGLDIFVKAHSPPPNYAQGAALVIERMSLVKDPLVDHLRDGADDLGYGIALAKSKLLDRILVGAAAVFMEKESAVKKMIGKTATYTPRGLLDLMGRAQGAKADIKGPVTCPDGTEYNQAYVIASYELANLPEVMDNWPRLFSSGDKKGQLFTDTTGDLLQSPMVDDYLNTGQLGKHFIVIDDKSNFLGVVQDNGNKGFEKCEFKEEARSLLDQAIDKLDLVTLQNVFKDMCAASDECQKQAAQRLLVTRPAKRAADNVSDDAPPGKKQKREDTRSRPRYELCQSCKKLFDITKNRKNSCRYHDGFLELVDEVFPDDDDVMYHPDSIDLETDWRREEWPEGFIYNCCEKNCKAKGCRIDKHMTAKESVEDDIEDYNEEGDKVEDWTEDEEDSEGGEDE